MSNPDSSLMWVEKYRPKSLNEIASQDQIIETLRRFLQNNRLPHLLFYGPPGTGKTSTILAIAKEIYGPSYSKYIMELNASDARGIDTIRNEIKSFASTRKLFDSGPKLIILDEADQMTKDAQNALRRIIENYTKNVRFCIICNYVNKIIQAIQSRCTKFRFQPLRRRIIEEKLQQIAIMESVSISNPAIKSIVRLSGGDMRKCLMILQSVALGAETGQEISENDIYLCTGKPTRDEMKNILHTMLNNTFSDSIKIILQLKETKGLALEDIISGLSEYLISFTLPLNEELHQYLFETLANIEYDLSFGASERVQLSAVIGAFQLVRKIFVEKKGSILELTRDPIE